MATTKRKISMREYLQIKAFTVTGNFDEDFSSFDDEFLDTVEYMSIYLPKGKEQAILDFIKKNDKVRKLKELREYAEFQQFKAKKKQQEQAQQAQQEQPAIIDDEDEYADL